MPLFALPGTLLHSSLPPNHPFRPSHTAYQGMFSPLPLLGMLALLGTAAAQACPRQYNECSNCCDVDRDCECDHYCPDHPEVWARGCAMPKAGQDGDFVCPAGYTKCPNCCASPASNAP